MRPFMAKPKVYIPLVLAFVVAVGVAAFWLTRKPQQTSWVLPDGSVLSLAKVTSGPEHVLPYGKSWLNPLYPIVPAAWRSKFRFKIASFKSESTNDLVVWLQRIGSQQQSMSLSFRLAVFD